ncbi:FliG C-terminal domain-containing protein [Loktanella sp. SALINAS62]|uniref:FliG C-terminal domain-containing protein n=1 Tax=Loktanella sp. SALINAS62 TaxID=2706124 RepID=UPI001B8CB58B|nr:FliG C-terminal domain-containing protein [Loktanella sp. SALINAS62]MBS1303517.1 flagellar motor switch protein FliG [Loktanella sp. SALINAS62]
MRHDPDISPNLPPIPHLTRRRKAAIIVHLLISDGGKLSLSDLPARIQEDLTAELGHIRLVDRDTVNAVAAEFADLLDAVGLSAPGGVIAALDALSDQLSPDIATRIRDRVTGRQETDPWVRLKNLDNDTILRVLTSEGLQIGAVLLAKMPVARAADLLGKLPGDRARALAVGIKQTEHIAPATVTRIGHALINSYSTVTVTAFAAPPDRRMGAILNNSPSVTRDALLDGLDNDDKLFAADIRKSIFTFNDIPTRIKPADIPMCLRDVDPAELAAAMFFATQQAGPAAAVAEFILGSLSQRMAGQIRDTMEETGEITPDVGDAAMNAVSAAIRAQADDGRITMIPSEPA